MSKASDLRKKKKQEKYRFIIISIAFLLIVILTIGIFSYRHYPSDNREEADLSMYDGYLYGLIHSTKQGARKFQSAMDKKAQDSVMIIENPDDVFPPEQVINIAKTEPVTPEEISRLSGLSAINIPQTGSLLFSSRNNALNNAPEGKVYYQSDNGSLASSISHNGNGTCEELISYDSRGNVVDKLEIGYIGDNIHHLKCAVIFKNKISIYETKLSANNKNEEIVIEYFISPELKFSIGKTYTKL
jgi:hypothetical protein